MNKIDELIEKLCPNGVKYIELKEICTFNRGKSITSKIAKNGNIPVISGGQKPAFYHNIANRPENTITIAGSGAYAGYVSFWKEPIFCSDAFSVDIINENILNKRYLYHFLLNNQDKIYSKKVGAGIPHVYGKDIANFFIPVPPLEIQSEIVCILDKYTDALLKLKELLKAELKARKKQYAYYREHFLTFGDEIPRKTLNEITNNISSGKNKERVKNGKYPVYGSTGIISLTNNAIYEKEQILIARVGANAGYVHIASGKYDVSDNALIVDLIQDINMKYIYYQLSNMNLHQYAKCGGQPLITAREIKEILIPIPSIKKQNEIVEILDKLDKLCNSLCEGIPAEIEARQKQYEYYRDKLLTFKELVIDE